MKGGKEGVTVVLATDSWGDPTVRYLGEVVNNAAQPSCFIDITFNTFGERGGIIDQGDPRATLNGFTMFNFGLTDHSCLPPGHFASFDTGPVDLDPSDPFFDFDFRVCFNDNLKTERCQFLAQARQPEIPLEDWLDVQVQGDAEGKAVFVALVRNVSAEGGVIPYNIRLHFSVLSGDGMVIDTALSSLVLANPSAEPCSQFNIIKAEDSAACLPPGAESMELTVATNAPYPLDCPECFYTRIRRSECVLLGDTCPNP